MVQASSSNKNLWVASSDGDIERVRHLIENQGMSPNDKDSNSYTPMHAAASYAHLELLTYLISKGGNINITDDDGETPLFVVETLEAARFLVENGAQVDLKNEDGLMAADQLSEDQPEISSYLYSLLPEDLRPSSDPHSSSDAADEEEEEGMGGISQLALENFTSEQSEELMKEAEKIMRECSENGTNPDERLRVLVESIVSKGLNFAQDAQNQVATGNGSAEGEETKRIREE